MAIRIADADARQINETLFALRKEGKAASGQVLTLVINTPAEAHAEALAEAREAGQIHPSRILVAIHGRHNGSGLSATVHTANSTTEVITLELSGAVTEHADSVLLPLLLPELPVVCWWPSKTPENMIGCPMRNLTSRFIIDTAKATDPIAKVHQLAPRHTTGITDLAWTRLTRWRALLVAALDQIRVPVRAAHLAAPIQSSPAELLRAWLESRLGISVDRLDPMSNYPGLHAVQLLTDAGPATIRRISATEAVLSLPGQPDRPVALARRSTQQLLNEELTRLTGDAAYDALMEYIAAMDAR